MWEAEANGITLHSSAHAPTQPNPTATQLRGPGKLCLGRMTCTYAIARMLTTHITLQPRKLQRCELWWQGPQCKGRAGLATADFMHDTLYYEHIYGNSPNAACSGRQVLFEGGHAT